jgi:hypothetical protein
VRDIIDLGSGSPIARFGGPYLATCRNVGQRGAYLGALPKSLQTLSGYLARSALM